MATIIASGDWWRLEDDGTLYVFCVGDMPYGSTSPWNSYRTQIAHVIISDGVTNIGSNAFLRCSALVSVAIPNSVSGVRAQAFAGCAALASVSLPDGVTSIGNSAFNNCVALTDFMIPGSVTSIGSSAFSGCDSLVDVVIPAGVTVINEHMFYGCDNLESVTIPESVTSVGGAALDNCPSLRDVYYGGTESQWNAVEIGADNNSLASAAIHYAPEPAALTSLAVTTPPTKTAYVAGETFDPSGMVVTATYSDASTAAVTDYSTSPTTALTLSDRVITVSYTEGGVTATANVAITVRRPPDLKLVFNGADFSDRVSAYRVSYEPNYRKVVTALNGTEYFGNATLRPVITFALLPMTDAQTRAAYDALKIMAASCAYTDPATNASRTARFRVTSNLESVFLLRAADGKRYYEGGTITLRGVDCLA